MSYRADDSGLRRTLAWLLRPAPRIYVLTLFVLSVGLLVLYGFSIAHTSDLSTRLSRDEAKTCQIQQRGLPAGHALAASMLSIHKLLTLRPTTPAQRQAQVDEPAGVRNLLARLNRSLVAYETAEAKQPHSRAC